MITPRCIRENSCRPDVLQVFNSSNSGFNCFNKEMWPSNYQLYNNMLLDLGGCEDLYFPTVCA